MVILIVFASDVVRRVGIIIRGIFWVRVGWGSWNGGVLVLRSASCCWVSGWEAMFSGVRKVSSCVESSGMWVLVSFSVWVSLSLGKFVVRSCSSVFCCGGVFFFAVVLSIGVSSDVCPWSVFVRGVGCVSLFVWFCVCLCSQLACPCCL